MKTSNAINNPEFLQIGALEDLRRNLQSKKEVIHEILIDELHHHVYLRQDHVAFSTNSFAYLFPTSSMNDAPRLESPEPNLNGSSVEQNLGKADDETNCNVNQELRPLHERLESLLNCLKLLGRLPETFFVIQQKLNTECFGLTERVISNVLEHVKLENEDHLDQNDSPIEAIDILDQQDGSLYDASLNAIKKLLQPSAFQAHIFRICVHQLLRDFCLVLESHRFILAWLETQQELFSEDCNYKDTPYRLKDIWLIIQNEVFLDKCPPREIDHYGY